MSHHFTNPGNPDRADLAPPLAAAQDGAPDREQTSPPIANRGAEMTIPPFNRSLIDWLSVTVKVDDPQDAIRIIDLDPALFTPVSKGKYGYGKSLRCDNITVLYNGPHLEMGCHIEMTGQGCRQYEGLQALPWLDLFPKFMAVGASVTRLDLAIDTVDGSLPLDNLYAALCRQEVRTLFSEWKRITKGSFRSDDDNAGETLYLGSTRSSTFFRVYNKAQEAKIEGSWIRFELELKEQRANQAALNLAGGMTAGTLATGIINTYFAVIEKSDSNISRCPMQFWWESWLLSTEKIRLGTSPAEKTVDDTMAFIKKQYAPSLAMIRQHLGDRSFNGFVREIITEGEERMNAKHDKMLQAAKNKKACRGATLKIKTGENA